ncbi:hypothetical protein MVEN_02595000 [Mycena venus]|uniref:Protein kinase domain-containing protein n=1 Tax=Mycena venus TaxID=2733690 RepID=A0A8H6TZS9_9AGAR|nr:hypothetical protein MVEN_02595000 [Mycena venus]
MDNDTHTAWTEPTSRSDMDVLERSCHAAVFNTSARDINMVGCITTSNFTFTTAPATSSDFRRIPLGDIDLRHEICGNYGTGVTDLQRERAYVRRVYSASVEGRKSRVTVAMYQGDGAEEQWQQAITKHSHPNIVQIWGTAKSANMHATIFHGDLIPLQQILDLYHHSHFLTVYIYACSVFVRVP